MTTKKKKVANVPNLRFPGFEREWEKKKLGQVATNKSEKYNPANATGSIKCIELEHLASESGQMLGYIDGSRSGSIKNVFHQGDILFGKLRPYLRKYLQAPFEGVCSSEIWVLKGTNVSNNFLYRIIQTNKFVDLANQSSGSKMPRADWNIVERGVFSFPSTEEQNKIASFLTLIDERIQTQNKIIEQLESLIKGMRDGLFIRKIRFPQFKEQWLRYKVSDFLIFFSTNSLSWEQLTYQPGAIHNLHYGLIHKHESPVIDIDTFLLPSIKTESVTGNYEYCQDGDIAFADASEDVEDVAKAIEFVNCKDRKIICGLHTIHGRDKLGITISGFKGYAFASSIFRQQIRQLAQGTKVFSISSKTFNECFVEIPTEKEQQEITGLLAALNQKLEVEKSCLSKYVIQKKHLLQNMFI